ncbi:MULTISPECIES: glycosyltransferase [Myroides]|uniref:Glycosyltransferase family 2 protein n=1 Tax=Myroides odoratus TaxID=256 RepID=A0A9Q7EC71_MYROD|nr:glycosyltransferase family 2 protein [Myroides odoratus]EHQ43997.1 glycosyl transferase family 2 [Myroides odoratus DSM 2801]EKB05106.1 hypothetical protein HMPREF9716_02913 [Myroides odoratus CIP 103059]QQU01295.1 glycosyltransferase family 2 protein [Myroides odoratus]WQD56445.1 glycosyltransferase family 2 protein [Myroides odoratus]STZ31275.1 dTDP-Rha:alpha-D-GlcNAc-pyrophosphate polyprenol, alpha-3-L-rhamnosyltransferase [Myroides odoratus]
MGKNLVSLSIVLYCTKELDIQNILKSIKTFENKINIFIIDNSPTKDLQNFFINESCITYIHNPSNPGFGASHNIAFRRVCNDGTKYHFVVNPDALFSEYVVNSMVSYLDEHNDIGMMMPQILNFDGTVQYLPKLLPNPFSIVLRKLKKPTFIYKRFIDKYELRNIDKDMIYEAPILSGCFTAFRISAIKEIGLYDDRFFMYFEDWDLSRRMNEKYKTIYYPRVSIHHGYESGANKSKKLFKIFVKSYIYYFTKWGWIFDSNRVKVNNRTLNQFL